VRWNPHSPRISRAREGHVVVLNGRDQAQFIPLDARQITSGRIALRCSLRRFQVRLEIGDVPGQASTESILVLLKSPPATTDDFAANPALARGNSHASIQAIGRSWVVACADGKFLLAKLFTAGNRDSIDFSRTALLRVGNAGAIRLNVDGKGLGALGAPGKVRIVELGREGLRFRSGGEEDDCTRGH
jgi:hypothetical protein